MRHSVFAGGKRLRPILCMQTAQMVAGDLPRGCDELGAAIEMLHTYSLIHDDLPALDDDELRRGKPTCHVVFGEDIAILAGDALQTQAYEVIAGLPAEPARVVAIVSEIARGTGTRGGMIGGQVMDLEAEQVAPTRELVAEIHAGKTGALITSAIVSGGLYAGADAGTITHLRKFGSRAGLAFQIVDDVLDLTTTSSALGKTAGKDAATAKATWPAVFGVDESLRQARGLIEEAFSELAMFGARAENLKAVARYLAERTH
jgi:geranylgeranyl diphosphate synthase type II